MESALSTLVEKISRFISLFLKKGESILSKHEELVEYNELKESIELIAMEDIGITPSTLSYFFQEGKICGIKILEEPLASISVFCLSKGTSLSLHDHPNMFVISKVLFGEIDKISMDLFSKTANPKIFKAHFKNLVSLKSPSLVELTPFEENIHSFYARSNCILFDVLIPNYDNTERICHFFKIVEQIKEDVDLEIIEEPDELRSFVLVRFPGNYKIKII